MLPSSKKYLVKSGFSETIAAWILLGCFMGGFAGIQIISKFLHHHIPSHVVDCDHNHQEIPHDHVKSHSRGLSSVNHHGTHSNGHTAVVAMNGTASESTPLLVSDTRKAAKLPDPPRGNSRVGCDSNHSRGRTDGRPSMLEVPSRVMSYIAEQIKDRKPNCDQTGPCYGYSEPCGRECLKYLAERSPISRTNSSTPPSDLLCSATHPFGQSFTSSTVNGDLDSVSPRTANSTRLARAHSHDSSVVHDSENSIEEDGLEAQQAQHHHHVPENAFMNIGLQTSIAIALHKIPEGFITYATNHANPSLGLSVFMALFVHNITEGFALALPLYLALHSRFRAMSWASLLGGISQPLGAGAAAAWFKLAGHEDRQPGSAVYGCMFAITAGIMTSVALQLFVEGLSLNHNRNLCIAFAFGGMSIMGISNALTSG